MLDSRVACLWLIEGDFNTTVSVDDKVNSSPIHQAEIQDLGDFVDALESGHLPKRGCDYSWCNKRDARVKIYI